MEGMPDSAPDPPRATNSEVRQCGALLIAIGLPAAYFLCGRYAGGVMPAEWIAYADIVLGLWMLIFPRPCRYRVGRLKLLGAGRQTKPPPGQ